jgi:hypothetical protein
MMAEEPTPRPAEPEPEPPGAAEPTEDERIDEMEQESFPASDPPSTWAGPPQA